MSDGLLGTQALLFDRSSPVRPSRVRIEATSEFHELGWTLLHGVSGIDSAIAKASSFLGSLNETRLTWHTASLQGLKLAKADKLPCRKPDIHESFQALHYDMGLPLAERDRQVGYLSTMLYFPLSGMPGQAETRIVQVEHLLRQRKFHSQADCDVRLHDYADKFGDGWTEPHHHITGRLGCLARIIDAMLDEHELVSFFDRGTWEWFKGSPASEHGHGELARETAWWARHGYCLQDVESRIRLQPGDLLLFDNVRCAHGRIGSRPAEEIWQVMWGVPHLDAAQISSMRNHVSAALAGV